jgi:hypothetical protein
VVDYIFVKAFQQMQKPIEWLQEAMNPFVAWGKQIVALALFVSASGSFWPPKAAADCQTPSFSASFYKIRWDKNHPKSI